MSPETEKQIFSRLFLNIPLGVANRNSPVRRWGLGLGESYVLLSSKHELSSSIHFHF